MIEILEKLYPGSKLDMQEARTWGSAILGALWLMNVNAFTQIAKIKCIMIVVLDEQVWLISNIIMNMKAIFLLALCSFALFVRTQDPDPG
jgi:hypothetical protein